MAILKKENSNSDFINNLIKKLEAEKKDRKKKINKLEQDIIAAKKEIALIRHGDEGEIYDLKNLEVRPSGYKRVEELEAFIYNGSKLLEKAKAIPVGNEEEIRRALEIIESNHIEDLKEEFKEVQLQTDKLIRLMLMYINNYNKAIEEGDKITRLSGDMYGHKKVRLDIKYPTLNAIKDDINIMSLLVEHLKGCVYWERDNVFNSLLNRYGV